MNSYAPSVRLDVARAGFSARFYLMVDTLGDTEGLVPFLATDEGRKWLADYPGVSTLSLAVLSGRFLGYRGPIPLERRAVVNGELLLVGYWFAMPKLGLAFDPSATTKSGARGAVFFQDYHPFSQGDSAPCVVVQGRELTPLPSQAMLCDEGVLSEVERIAVGDVLAALNKTCRYKCPSLDALHRYFIDGCSDIPIE